MRLYHYSTWRGAEIFKAGWVHPRDLYQVWTGNTVLMKWPHLVFLSINAEWEPSIQSMTKERYWEKCGSHPEVYTQLNIPCWRFEVDRPGSIMHFSSAAQSCGRLWNEMIDDAICMGSNPDQWIMTQEPVRVRRVWKWEDRWKMLRE
jgi:hypothetical protein